MLSISCESYSTLNGVVQEKFGHSIVFVSRAFGDLDLDKATVMRGSGLFCLYKVLDGPQQ